jgi:predicted phosphodiesterase
MKFAIIADIHANLRRSPSFLEDIKQQKCTHYACLGDVVVVITPIRRNAWIRSVP